MKYFGISMELEMDLWLFFKSVGAVFLLKSFPLYRGEITNIYKDLIAAITAVKARHSQGENLLP